MIYVIDYEDYDFFCEYLSESGFSGLQDEQDFLTTND